MKREEALQRLQELEAQAAALIAEHERQLAAIGGEIEEVLAVLKPQLVEHVRNNRKRIQQAASGPDGQTVVK